jgi:hypothetical protein
MTAPHVTLSLSKGGRSYHAHLSIGPSFDKLRMTWVARV